VAKAADVNWSDYFKSIRAECPWSYKSWQQGLIDIRDYDGELLPLDHWHARVYVCRVPQDTLEALAFAFDEGECEWLWSFPNDGPYSTPVPVLIQQNREVLRQLREKLT